MLENFKGGVMQKFWWLGTFFLVFTVGVAAFVAFFFSVSQITNINFPVLLIFIILGSIAVHKTDTEQKYNNRDIFYFWCGLSSGSLAGMGVYTQSRIYAFLSLLLAGLAMYYLISKAK